MTAPLLDTWLTSTFGLDVPVVCAPMAGVAAGNLAAAVSRAGALGMIGVGDRTSPEWIAAQAAIASSSGRPFGVGLQAWALDLNPGQEDAALESGASIVSLSYGPYAGYVARFRERGILVATTVGNLSEAYEAEAAGVDVIITRGSEAGGHGRNDVATLPLLQSVLDEVDTPVVAAGGIGNARGLAAVLAAGAVGAWVGTAFCATTEGTSTPAARARLVAASGSDTVYTRVFDIAAGARWPAEYGERALRNAFYDEWAGRESDLVDDESARARMGTGRAADTASVICVDAGEGVGLITAESSAADVVHEFARAAELLARSPVVPLRPPL